MKIGKDINLSGNNEYETVKRTTGEDFLLKETEVWLAICVEYQ